MSTRISPGTFEKLVPGIGTVLYTKTQVYSDGSAMTDEKCDGLNYIKVDYEYFKAVNPQETIESEPSFSEQTFDL